MNHKPSIMIKRRLLFFLTVITIGIIGLIFRISYIQIIQGDYLKNLAWEQQTRDRLIAPQRGSIYDRNGIPLAQNASVATVSVIHNQIQDKEEVIEALVDVLDLEYEEVKQKVERVVALERIKSRVDKEVADKLREKNIPGIVVDEDSKRYYPHRNLASHVLGFVGKDNQGIIGIEVKYDEYLRGIPGKIVTESDAKGRDISGGIQKRIEPLPGNHLVTSIDIVVQQYAEQALEKVLQGKEAKKGSILIMNPKTGEILAMANKPDFDLNEPFRIQDPTLQVNWNQLSQKEQMDALNQMWRNFSINDTYEPGSTFKIVTSTAGLEEKVVTLEDTFSCPGYRIVADRRIRCHKTGGHGTETFLEGVLNSCNPVFMDVADRLGAEAFYKYMKLFGFDEKTGIDIPGEAVGIMHDIKKVGPVELATMSFGQSFQITPLQLIRAGAAIVNGGYLVTPHIGRELVNEEGNIIKIFEYDNKKQIISKETSDIMRSILESVVSEGTGHRTYLPGYKIGGKTATSEKLPRSNHKYIASFIGFAPADDPQVIALILIDEPVGIYYGGTVAAPVVKEIFENILPYLGIEPKYTDQELTLEGVGDVDIPNVLQKSLSEVRQEARELGLTLEVLGEGNIVKEQFPLPGEKVSKGTKLIIYIE
ncbi:MAG: PASTA domain-containing protein [Epulopiscium sp.]|nr:PASTA domain-containing protein [Candidatus Epulonipiscium sp.]